MPLLPTMSVKLKTLLKLIPYSMLPAGNVVPMESVKKTGVRISILYQTSTNSVRQATQAFIKEMWKQIGVETELRNLSASVFFGGDIGSPDTYQKFYTDIEMYTNNFSGTDPQTYMSNWTCKEMAQKSNKWGGNNMPRWCNPAYDALSAKMSISSAMKDRIRLTKAMNDMLMQDYAMIPLIHRGVMFQLILILFPEYG